MIGMSWLVFAVAAALELDLFRHLIEPAHPNELAAELDVDPKRLTRLLRALTAGEILVEEAPHFQLSERGELLLESNPESLAPLFVLAGSAWHTRAWCKLGAALTTERTPFLLTHNADLPTHLEEHPAHARMLNQAFGSVQSPVGSLNVPDAIAEAIGDIGSKTIVDVGGGEGTVLSKVLHRNPLSTATLLERPDVAKLAQERLRRSDLTDRVAVAEGDFFEAVPPGGDIYLLCYVLEDWEDDSAKRLLSQCRAAMGEAGVLMVVEELARDDSPMYSRLFDLETMVIQGGEERTLPDLEHLLVLAGFQVGEIICTKVATATIVHAMPN